MSNSGLAFYFDGPLQAWGSSSRFQRRETELYPTKSGVVGLMAAALGIDKHGSGEADELVPLASLKLTIYRLDTDGVGRLQRLSDFHTVGGGYDNKNPVEKLHITRKASGGASSNAVLTRRVYLTDARFVVVCIGSSELLIRCSKALENPVWGVWFGRKCCIPAAPLLPTLGESAGDAVSALIARLSLKRADMRIGAGQCESEGDGSWFQADHPLSFRDRIFKARPVRRTDA